MKRVLAIILLTGSLSVQAQQKNFIDQPYLEVTAMADSMVTPDEIYIRIQLSEKDTRDKVSIGQQETKMADALKSLGIDPEKDLSVTDIASSYQYHLFKNKNILKVKSYSLKVGDAVTATKVFAALEEAGISTAAVERVDHSSIDAIKNQLRTDAVRTAKEKAVALTAGIGQEVGKAIHLTEYDQATNTSFSGDSYGLVIRGVSSLKRNQAEIEFQKFKVALSVSVKFALK